MKIKHKKKLKLSQDLTVGDEIRVAGLLCEILKVEDVFHHTPKSRIRMELKILGATGRTENAILFFSRGVAVETLV